MNILSDPTQPMASDLPAHHYLRSDSLIPLPSELRDGLITVTIFGFVSFLASVSLFLVLSWRICKWLHQSKTTNRFIVLIYNLVLADIQQSIAFVLNAAWLSQNGISIDSSNCWAQGWFISTGDLASGAFCFFIAMHTFLSIVLNYRMSNSAFSMCTIGIWLFVYALALIGVALHPNDIYVRAVSWCWINAKYGNLRLWLHYFWIFAFEFGTVLIYIITYTILTIRIKSEYYNSLQAQHARTAAKMMIVYPIIYVFCTLPLASLRMYSMASNKNLSFRWFCFAGAMITSNGWMDVLVYTLTRRIMIFSDEPPSDSCGIETFTVPFAGPSSLSRFGTKTTCAYSPESGAKRSGYRWRQKSDLESGLNSDLTSFTSTAHLFDGQSPSPVYSSSPKFDSDIIHLAVKTTTTFEVRHELVTEAEDVQEIRALGRSPSEKYRWDFEPKPGR